MAQFTDIIAAALAGEAPEPEAALALVAAPLEPLLSAAESLTLAGHGRTVTYSRKVFIPLTQLCRDVCHYCTFAQAPRTLPQPYLSLEQVLDIARAGARAGCQEALFTLGDKPELRYPSARRALAALGFGSTLEYLAHCAREVQAQTGLLPHLNPGVMTAADLAPLRKVSRLDGTDARERQRAAVSSAAARISAPRTSSRRCAWPRSRPPASSRSRSRRDSSSASARRAPSAWSRSSPCARCTRATGTCRNSSSRTSAPSAARAWRSLRSPRSRSSCGRSPWRA